MSSNFRILVHRNGDSLHLKLEGEFDGSSAHELLNYIKKHSAGVRRIFVHTNGVKRVHSFGRDIFRNNLLNSKDHSINIIFTGEFGAKIAPMGSRRILG